MIAVTFGLARYGYGLLLPEMRTDLGMSAGAAGLVSSATYVSYLVANVAVVQVTERWGPRAAVALAAATAVAGMATIAVADTVAVLGVGVLVGGAASGFAFPPYADIVDRHVPAERRDVVWSTISSGTGWGVALAGPVAIVAGDQWRLAWAGFVAIAVVVGVAATRLAPARDDDGLRRPQLSVTWFFCPRSRPLLLSAVLVGIGSSVWWAFSVDAMQNADLGSTASRAVYATCGAACLLGSISGLAFAHTGLRSGYLAATALLAASLGLLAVATAQLALALVAAVSFGAFYASVIAAQGIWSAQVFAGHPAAGLAAVSAALTVGTLVGPSLAGVVIQESGHAVALLGAAAATAAALPFCPPSTRRRERLEAHREHCRATPVRD
ncbi:putative MFS family arabinose efflux permease [Nocardioides thalensis]|uniref:Putative MFS family arabinose efflux permease n=1 Tax=Nocardioides thalensis TaxID=1914755 RepID=A0A853C1K2_9ACTN|nr:MFS transporter [Nocardioides thalensis]NYJ02090.1 putative MFS family arabinose efflux permease [Nocardioides thalensis]